MAMDLNKMKGATGRGGRRKLTFIKYVLSLTTMSISTCVYLLNNGSGSIKKHLLAAAPICTYEGNCPALTTCGASGRCVPYLTSQQLAQVQDEAKRSIRADSNPQRIGRGVAAQVPSSSSPQLAMTSSSACIRRCVTDVLWDERFFFTTVPKVLFEFDYVQSAMGMWGETPANGCVVVYSRAPSSEPQPKLDEWNEHRSGAIVRRDPVKVDVPHEKDEHKYSVGGGQRWAVLCYDQCMTDTDCNTETTGGSLEASFLCTDSRCERQNKDQQSNYSFDREALSKNATKREHVAISDLVVVSAASRGFFTGLKELAASLRYWAPHSRLAVYNLGLADEQIAEIEGWSNVIAPVLWRDGRAFDEYPPHVRKLRSFAFKPLVLADSVKRFRKVLVLDAGSNIRAPLDPIERILERTGNFLTWGQDVDMMPKAHEGTFRWLNHTKETFQGGPHYSGGTQGYLYPSASYNNIVVPLVDCALDVNCITPPGSNSLNHRQDQTAVSIISYHFDVMVQPHTDYLAADKSQLNSDFLQPSNMVIWTARQSSVDYSAAGY